MQLTKQELQLTQTEHHVAWAAMLIKSDAGWTDAESSDRSRADAGTLVAAMARLLGVGAVVAAWLVVRLVMV